MKPFVDIEGSGEHATKFTGAGGTSEADGSTLLGANDAELRFLTVENTGGSGLSFAIAIYNDGASPWITHVTAVSVGNGASAAYGILNSGSAPAAIEATVAAAGAATNPASEIRPPVARSR